MCLVNAFLVSEGEVHERLCSESVLLIRREDVLQRLTSDVPLSAISDHPDSQWKVLDVEGGFFVGILMFVLPWWNGGTKDTDTLSIVFGGTV